MFHTYKRLVLPVYFPTLLTAIVQSALAILLPLYMLELGHSIATASYIVAFRGIGLLLTDVPAGIFANRFGDKPSMLFGCFCSMAAMGLLGFTDDKGLIIFASILSGSSVSFTLLGRTSYLADSVINAERGRAIALMAGLQRAGALLGPLLFGAIAKYLSYQAAFMIMSVLVTAAFLSISLFAIHHETTHRKKVPVAAMFGVVTAYRKLLLSIGLGGLGLMMLRSARILLFPVFGHTLGMDEVMIGLLFSLSSVVDMLMFYPAGQVMDINGRKWTAVPGTVLLSVSVAVLPFVPSITGMFLFAIISGLGNGITTGVLLTIGSDIAPDTERGQFLGVWRLLLDAGHTASPLIVGSLSEVASLSLATLSISIVGMTGAVIFALLMKETLLQKE